MDSSDFDVLKTDVAKLFADIGSTASTASDDVKEKLEQSRTVLQEKMAAATAKAAELRDAGANATDELRAGFSKAADELKQAIAAARTHLTG